MKIGGLFPLVRIGSGRAPALDSSGILQLTAFLLAINEINNKRDGIADDLLPNTTLTFAMRDSRRDSYAALVAALELTGMCGTSLSRANDFKPDNINGVAAVVGASSSGPSMSAAQVFTNARVPQISYASTSPRLSDGIAYPYFLRTPPSDSFQADAIVDLIQNFFNYTAFVRLGRPPPELQLCTTIET